MGRPKKVKTTEQEEEYRLQRAAALKRNTSKYYERMKSLNQDFIQKFQTLYPNSKVKACINGITIHLSPADFNK